MLGLIASTPELPVGTALGALAILVLLGGALGAAWAAITRSRIEQFRYRIVELERKHKECEAAAITQGHQIESQRVALKALQDTVSNVSAIQDLSRKVDHHHEELLLAIHDRRTKP